MSEQLSPQDRYAQTELLEMLLAAQPTVIGLEGGPCSGKTTLLQEITARAHEVNRPVVVLPEAASQHLEQLQAAGRTIGELIEHDRPAYLEFEHAVLGTIISGIKQARERYAGTDAVIVADRVDIGAYVQPTEYRRLLNRYSLRRPPLHQLVDKLIFLPSVASERPELYRRLRGTNGVRIEATAAEAAAVCAANMQAVQTHPELLVAWGGDFSAKIRRLAGLVLHPEQEPEIKLSVQPREAKDFLQQAQRRGNQLHNMLISQSYHQLNGREFRLRRTGTSQGADYHWAAKAGSGTTRHELQRRLNVGEYTLLQQAQQLGKTLVKQRYVVLDDPDTEGKRRLWYADEYYAPELAEWHFETDVHDEAEARMLEDRYSATRRRIVESAKALIFK